MKLKRLSIVLLIVTLALLALLPAALQLLVRGVAVTKGYSGYITVWQIEGAAKANTAFLRALADFEREHFSVFITPVMLTPEQAAQRFSNGERPDVISAQPCHIPETELLPIDVRGLPRPFLPFDGFLLPYAADMYVLCIDDSLEYPAERTLSYTKFRSIEDEGDWVITEIKSTTDLIRCVCALPSGNALKDEMSVLLCRSLISVKNQRRVMEKGLLPSVSEFETFCALAEFTDDTLARGFELLISEKR